RYNVALSRARDRMVLVRSVTPSMLKEGDIKLEALRHFQDPMAGGHIGQSDDVLAACESGFERDVGKHLLRAGYRLRAQVPVGGYHIDFVVEGANDRRLAIELDGDGFHGPDRWAEDVRRQKTLERVGWIFWRCWASEWESDKEGMFRDLVATLERNGIGPIGAAPSANGALVEFRRVRYYAPRPEPLRPGAPQPEPLPPTPRLPKPPPIAVPRPPPASGERPELPGLFAQAVRAQPSRPAPVPEPVSTTDFIRKVRVGDIVVVRYADGTRRSRTVHIVADGTADGRDRISPTSPLGKAVIGLHVEDEAEIEVDGKPRPIIVEEIRDGA
ncbi:MAG: DUF559 domain-containing protein, partial [Acetobacteraceae bacterium]